MNSPNPIAPQQQSSSPVLIIVAVGLGLLTVLLTMFYIRTVRADIEGRFIYVFRVNKNLEPGDRLDIRKDLTAVGVSDKLKEGIDAMGIIVQPGQEPPTERQDQSVNRPVHQGEFLSSSLFTGFGKGVDEKVTNGKRGTPLEINSRNAPGLLRPQMIVDISANFVRPGEKIPQAMRIMEHVKVLAVGAQTEETNSNRRINYNTITVETEPTEDLALLTIAKFVGKDGFDISIRNRADNNVDFIGINKDVLKLLGMNK